MEHSDGQFSFSESRKFDAFLEPPARPSPSFTVSQKVSLIWFVLFTTHAVRDVLAATRNETFIREWQSDSAPVWNQTRYRVERKCQDFHNGTHKRWSELFFYWPEDNPMFQYCCTYDIYTNDTASPNFRYSEYGEMLRYAIYWDVGYFDQCLPFWKCRKTFRDIFQTHLYFAYCEKTDLAKLYWERFWKLIVWKYSLQQTILPWLLILEVAVFLLALAIFPLTWGIAREKLAKPFGWKDLVPTGKIWLKSIWRRLVMDWGHMYLLVMVGNGLFEAIRRQSVYSMQSKLFFAYSMLYFVLFVILSCTSVVQQLAYWIGSATEPKVRKYLNERATSSVDKEGDRVQVNSHVKYKRVSIARSYEDKPSYGHDGIELAQVNENTYYGDASSGNKLESQAEICSDIDEKCMLEGTRHDHTITSTQSNSFARLICCFCFKKRSMSKTSVPFKKIKGSFRKLLSVEVFQLGADYKWQPIATQATILFALGILLTVSIDSDDESSELFGLLLGYIVQAGCLWTGTYSVIVFFQRGAYIYRFLEKLRVTDDLQPDNRNETCHLESEGSSHTLSTCAVQISEAAA